MREPMPWGPMRLASVAAVMLAVILWPAGSFAATPINGVSVSVLPQPTTFSHGETFHGYVEYRIFLANASVSPRAVRLTMPGTPYKGYGIGIGRITRRVELAGHASTTVSLFQPPLPLNGRDLRVDVNGRLKHISMAPIDHAKQHASRVHHGGHNYGAVLLSKAVHANFRTRADSYAKSGPTDLRYFQQEIPPAQWSDHWLGYSRYDGLVVTAADVDAMPQAVISAIRKYVALGGCLTVLGDWTPAGPWRVHGAAEVDHDITSHALGFGEVQRLAEQDAGLISPQQYRRMGRSWQANARLWYVTRSPQQANRDFPVVEDVSVPVGGLLVLMIAFTIVIGPLNLWVLGRRRRRMWLLWTVPAISLVTCLAIWVYAVAAEGFGADRRIEAITLLDQRDPRDQHGVTIGFAGYYAPLTPGGGFAFDPQTELTPQVRDRSGHDTRTRTVDLTHGQRLDSGWVVARVPAHFMVRKPHDSVRERLVVERAADGDGYVATNGFGVGLARLWYADADGTVYEAVGTAAAPAAQAGAKVKLKRTSHKTGGSKWRDFYTQDWIDSFQYLRDPSAREQARRLAPNTYLAVLDGQPFVEPGLPDSTPRHSRACVLGLVAPVPHSP